MFEFLDKCYIGKIIIISKGTRQRYSPPRALPVVKPTGGSVMWWGIFAVGAFDAVKPVFASQDLRKGKSPFSMGLGAQYKMHNKKIYNEKSNIFPRRIEMDTRI